MTNPGGNSVDWVNESYLSKESSSSNKFSSANHRRSPGRLPKVDSAASINPSSWGGNSRSGRHSNGTNSVGNSDDSNGGAAGRRDDKEEIAGATSQQIGRYSTMIRLGIPDVAVLRSTERDGIEDPQGVLRSLKEKQTGIPAGVRGKRASTSSLLMNRSVSRKVGGGLSKELVALSASILIGDRQDIWQRRGPADSPSSSVASSSSSRNNSGDSTRRKNDRKEGGSLDESKDGGGGMTDHTGTESCRVYSQKH